MAQQGGGPAVSYFSFSFFFGALIMIAGVLGPLAFTLHKQKLRSKRVN